MKRIIISLCLLFNFYQAGYSQTLLDTNKLWTNIVVQGLISNSIHTSAIKLGNEVLISGKAYHKMLISNDSAFQAWMIYCYIRETADNKVYFLVSEQDSIEKLAYDFNLVAGDSISYYSIFSPYGLPFHRVVTSDSLEYFAGSWRKKLTVGFTLGMNGEDWYMGIGSECGIIYNGTWGCSGTSFLLGCYFQNDTLLYSNQIFPLCYYNYDNVAENQAYQKTEYIIYPNPCDGELTIDIQADKNNIIPDKIEIFNILSDKIYSLKLISSVNEYKIDLANYQNGVFFIKFIKDDKLISIKKFILGKQSTISH